MPAARKKHLTTIETTRTQVYKNVVRRGAPDDGVAGPALGGAVEGAATWRLARLSGNEGAAFKGLKLVSVGRLTEMGRFVFALSARFIPSYKYEQAIVMQA